MSSSISYLGRLLAHRNDILDHLPPWASGHGLSKHIVVLYLHFAVWCWKIQCAMEVAPRGGPDREKCEWYAMRVGDMMVSEVVNDGVHFVTIETRAQTHLNRILGAIAMECESRSLPPLPPIIQIINRVSRYSPRRVIHLEEVPREFDLMDYPGDLADSEELKEEIKRQVETDQWWVTANEPFAQWWKDPRLPESAKARQVFEINARIHRGTYSMMDEEEEKIDRLQRELQERIALPAEEKRKYLEEMGMEIQEEL